MILTNSHIDRIIDDYTNRGGASNVIRREWKHRYLRGHAPWNNEEDCYHRWLDIIDAEHERLNSIKTFDELYKEVEKLKINGIGDLTIYDTATMIGCPSKVYPDKVYLHAGAAEGAKALGVKGSVVDKSVFVAIFPAFTRLEPMQIEDMLCIYKSHLQGNPMIFEELNYCCTNKGAKPGSCLKIK